MTKIWQNEIVGRQNAKKDNFKQSKKMLLIKKKIYIYIYTKKQEKVKRQNGNWDCGS